MPGLIATLSMIQTMTLAALSVAREREQRHIRPIAGHPVSADRHHVRQGAAVHLYRLAAILA